MDLRQVLFKGRVNRRTYWAVVLALLAVEALTVTAVLFWPYVKEWYYFTLPVQPGYIVLKGLAQVCLIAETAAWLVIWTANNAKRLRDIGWSPWWAVLALIPVAPLVLGVLPGVDEDEV